MTTLSSEAILVLSTLACAFGLFIWDRWRYDLVSIGALLFLAVTGPVPAKEVFLGFSHPAVSTVIAVLIISKGIQNSGLLEFFSQTLTRVGSNLILQLLILCSLTALLSAFVNNIGALAVVMPIALGAAKEQKLSPSLYLMPIAFSSLLGGLTTLIGTPPNIIISSFRAEALGQEFALFDYAFAGFPIAAAGVLMVAMVGWRLLPLRRKAESGEGAFDVGAYTMEVVIPKGSQAVGMTFKDLQDLVNGELLLLVAADKKGKRLTENKTRPFKEGDLLVIEGPPQSISRLLKKSELKIASDHKLEEEAKLAEEQLLAEAVLSPSSSLVGRMPRAATLRRRFGVALLAVARQGRRLRRRFSQIKLRSGDVLLLRGEEENLDEMMRDVGALPLAQRGIQVGLRKNSFIALAIFLAAILLVLFQWVPAHIAFALGAVGMVANGVVSVRSVYQHVDWSIVILLGALLPIGKALESSGAADFIVQSLLLITQSLPPEGVLVILLVGVMFLSDLINNAAAAALSAPIALRIADSLSCSPDPFLMAVAIGASCAFLTPVGHQSNTLVMGPGGYRFMDYWKLGLPLEILIVTISVPALLYFWPLAEVVTK